MADAMEIEDQQKPEEKNQLLILEEDDEFEEFELEGEKQIGYDEDMEDQAGLKQWEEAWDDDEKQDSFAQTLRAELIKSG